MFRIIALLCLSIALLGCQHSGAASQASDQLDNSFPSLQDYNLGQFQLSAQYDYWELRALTQEQKPSGRINPIAFDASKLSLLNGLQLEQLNQARSHYDQLMVCESAPCSYYALALSGEQVTVIDSQEALLALLGEIDTPAELHLWLWANRLTAESYEEVYGGYLVVADSTVGLGNEEGNRCGNANKALLLVDYNGGISQRELWELSDDQACHQASHRILLANNP